MNEEQNQARFYSYLLILPPSLFLFYKKPLTKVAAINTVYGALTIL